MSQIYILGILTFALMFSVTMVYPILKYFVMDRFYVGAAQAGMFVSVALISYVIFAPLWGAISDKLGRRKPLIVLGFFGASLAMFSLTLADSLQKLLLLRLVEGAFVIMAFSLIMTKALDEVKRMHYGKGMGIIGAGMAFGNALGAPAGGKIGMIHVFYPMYFGSLLLLLAALLSILVLKETQLETKASSVFDALKLLGEEKRLGIPYAFSFVERFTVGFFVGVFPIFLASDYGLAPGKIGIYMAAFLIPFALLQYPCGLVSDKIGRVPPLIVGSLLYGICVSLVGAMPLSYLAFLMIFGGIFGALMYPPTAALAGDLAHEAKKGVAMGGFNLFGSLGFAVGPFVGGMIADSYGYKATFAFAGATEILIAIVLLPLLLRLRM